MLKISEKLWGEIGFTFSCFFLGWSGHNVLADGPLSKRIFHFTMFFLFFLCAFYTRRFQLEIARLDGELEEMMRTQQFLEKIRSHQKRELKELNQKTGE